MVDTRDALEIARAAATVEWAGYVDSWKGAARMKLATLADGGRDGRLVGREPRPRARRVARAGDRADAAGSARRLGSARRRARRRSRSARGGQRGEPFAVRSGGARWRRCRAPITGWTAAPTSITSSWCARRAAPTMPRVLLDRSARLPGRLGRFPRPPTADAPFASEDWGIDLEGEVAVITDDVPMGTERRTPRARTSSS